MSTLSTDDRLEIQELTSRYCHCVDRGRWDEFLSLFTADCRLDLTQVMGLYEGHNGVRAFAETMKSVGVFMRHLTTNVVLRGDGEKAQGEAYVLAITGMPGSTQQTTGFYDDEFVKQDGRWLFRSRRLALDVPKA